jgi:hypothetical protein
MSDTIDTRTATCPTHGAVRAERQMPRPGFPFIVYAVRKMLASNRPYRCPDCGAPVLPG